jgi:hypothetical protein
MTNDYAKKIACAMIRQAVDDVNADTKFLREAQNDLQEGHRATAIIFLRSRFFDFLCDSMGLSASNIRLQAFK